MGILSEYFGEFKHASFARESDEKVYAKTPASTQFDAQVEYARVPRRDLEQLYISNPQTFNTINIYKQMLLQAGYRIRSINTTGQKQYDQFFEQIGQVGMKVGEKQLMDRIIHDVCLYGYAYVERVFSADGKRVLDLKPVDAKLMDYARNHQNIILTNDQQNPIGYVMTVGYYINARGDPLPKGYYAPTQGGAPTDRQVKMMPNQIFLDEKRIACFTLFPFGNGFESMGIVEPAYLAIQRKLAIETAVANTIHNTAAYPIYAVVGDGITKPSPKLMDATLNTLQNFSYNRYGVFAHPTALHTLDVKHSDQADTFLRYLRTEESAASGLALGFTVGSGETINRSTLNTQKEMLDIRMDSLADSIAEQFTKKILNYIKDVNKYSSYAVMEWNDVSTEDKLEKSNILLSAITSGAILPQEARKYILHSNDIEGDEEDYKEFLEKREEEAEFQREMQVAGVKEKTAPEKKKKEEKREEKRK